MNLKIFFAFSIIIFSCSEITKTINAEYNTKSYNDLDEYSSEVVAEQPPQQQQHQQHAFKTKIMNEYHSESKLMALKLITTDKIKISAAKPSHFNKNSLQERQQQLQHQHSQQHSWTTPQQRHFKDQYTLDNKHPPCDYVEQHTTSSIVTIAEGNKIFNTGALSTNFNTTTMSTMTTTTMTLKTTKSTSNATQIDATAKGYKPLGPQHTTIIIENSVDTNVTSFTKNNGGGPFHSTALNVARNGFRDKINISNQRNEFRSDDDEHLDNDVDYNGTGQKNDSDNYDDVGGSGNSKGDGVVVQLHHHQKQTQQKQQSAKRLKRKNRTITVAVAVDVDDVDDTTNNNTKSNNITSRNNSNNIAAATTNAASSSFFERVELLESSLSPDKRHELRQHRRKRYLLFPEGSSFQLVFDLIIGVVDYTSYAILGITCSVAWELPSKPPSEIVENLREKLNDGTFGLQRRNDSISLKEQLEPTPPPPTPLTATQNSQTYQGTAYKAADTPTKTSYYGHNYPYNGGYKHIPAEMASLPGVVAHATHDTATATATGDNFMETQRKTLNDKEDSHWHWSRPDKFYYNKYSKYADEWSGNDKRKYAADWHQQRGSDNANDNEFNNNASHDNRDDYIAKDSRYEYSQRPKNNAGWQQQKDNNSWQRNKQRWQQWRQYRREYMKNNNNWQSYTPRLPVTSYNNQRTGRQRKILKEPPKHRIYPVFVRRRRSTESPQSPTQLELEMERLHFREQLRSRQKLYGKIELLFQTRGHNGTACVLRALCETGQRQQHPNDAHQHHQFQLQQHQQQQEQQRHRHHRSSDSGSSTSSHRHRRPHSTTGQLSEPQSFITELLRAIFALPKDVHSWDAGPAFQLLQHRELETHMPLHYREAHSYTGDCAERFVNCEHSIWSDGITLRSRTGFQ